MRFKARITNEHLSILVSVTSALMKIGPSAVIFLDEECLRFAVVADSPDNPRVYAELVQGSVFAEYRIESQSQNTILFEIELELLNRALSSGKHAPQCYLKLVKRDQRPCLCLETRASEVDIVHDIPIKVMKASDIMYYSPPDVPAPQVALELPRGKLMKTIIDRMSKIAKQVHITAEQAGRIVLRVDDSHSCATIKTYYGGLQPRFDEPMRVESDSDNVAVVKVDIKKLSSVLTLHGMIWESSCIYFSDNEALIFNVMLSPGDVGSVTYYIPVVLLSDEERNVHIDR